MKKLIKLNHLFLFLFLFALFGLLYKELYYSKARTLPSPLVGEVMPAFDLADLTNPERHLTPDTLKGKVSLLNVWASWCGACSSEQAMLMKISEDYHIPIYAINYKDEPEKAQGFLENYGNPFQLIGTDKRGDVAIDLGVYGTPETFVINAKAEIIYRHVGAIDQRTWDEVLYPLVKKQMDMA